MNKKDLSKSSCAVLINSHNPKIVDLKKIIECVHFLSKQGLAFRGHAESFASNNRGNFKELLSF